MIRIPIDWDIIPDVAMSPSSFIRFNSFTPRESGSYIWTSWNIKLAKIFSILTVITLIFDRIFPLWACEQVFWAVLDNRRDTAVGA